MAKIVESKTIVGLEVGTSKVVAVVGEVLHDGVVNVLGVGSCPSKVLIKYYRFECCCHFHSTCY